MPKAAPRFSFGKPPPERKAWRTTTGTTTERGYGWQHQKMRKQLLRREPLCRACKEQGRVTAAIIADHIVPLAEGGLGHVDNLQPLCRDCHKEKTLAESARGVTANRFHDRI